VFDGTFKDTVPSVSGILMGTFASSWFCPVRGKENEWDVGQSFSVNSMDRLTDFIEKLRV
jgi:hypothetical protein